MASVVKFKAQAVVQELRHNHREIEHSSNPDIDPTRSGDNDYTLTPDHGGLSPYQYYKARLDDLYIYDRKRKDINTAFGWIITLPKEITDPAEEQRFFSAASDFLIDRYGEINTVSITIHRDEGGQPHLHYIAIPAVKNNMQSPEHPQAEKLSCKEVINRKELRSFHPALQSYLNEQGIAAPVYTGVTAGHNRTVKDLKRATMAELQSEVQRLQEIERKYNELIRKTDRNRWERSEEHERGRW